MLTKQNKSQAKSQSIIPFHLKAIFERQTTIVKLDPET